METLKQIWQYKPFRVLCWQLFNAVIAFGITYLWGIEGEYQAVVIGLWIPVLNIITKWVNTTYFWDLGVEKVNEQ